MANGKSSGKSTANMKVVEGGAAGQSLGKDLLLKIYGQMLLYRRFEERVLQAYTKQKFSGFCHVYIGQEAVGVGIQENLRATDYMISGYRSHAQAIGKGIDPKAVLAELFGRVDGCVRGKGGSMHMLSAEKRFLGGHGIVGGQVPLATGVGFAIKYRKEDDICVCYMGDAATNQGQVHEAMNMAATWDLPVLFVIENNRYGMGTDIRRTTSVDHLWKRALGYDMDHSTVDGMDVLKVYPHVREIVQSMRRTMRPHLLEANTYRFKGHSVSDPATYRSKEEVESYQNIDPLKTLSEHLLKEKFIDTGKLDKLDEEVRARVKAAEEFAEQSPLAPLEDLWAHVYA